MSDIVVPNGSILTNESDILDKLAKGQKGTEDYDQEEDDVPREFGATDGLLKFQADIKTLIWTFGIIPVNFFLQLFFPTLSFFVLPLSCYFALIAAVIVHNHTHCGTFVSPVVNNFFDCYLTFLYGYPVFAWHSTHKSTRGHHGFVNRPGDPAPTWYLSNEHSNFLASTYFFISAWLQGTPISQHLEQAKKRRHTDSKYYWILAQYATLFAGHIATATFAISMNGAAIGIRTYLLALLIPSAFSLYSIMFINYIQHVHTDAHDAWNHSRNFTGWWLNFFLFNNGYHTAHHNQGGLHWSLLPAAHKKIEHKISKTLLVEDFNQFCLDNYVRKYFNPEVATKQIGKNPWDTTEPIPQCAPLKCTEPLWNKERTD